MGFSYPEIRAIRLQTRDGEEIDVDEIMQIDVDPTRVQKRQRIEEPNGRKGKFPITSCFLLGPLPWVPRGVTSPRALPAVCQPVSPRDQISFRECNYVHLNMFSMPLMFISVDGHLSYRV